MGRAYQMWSTGNGFKRKRKRGQYAVAGCGNCSRENDPCNLGPSSLLQRVGGKEKGQMRTLSWETRQKKKEMGELGGEN